MHYSCQKVFVVIKVHNRTDKNGYLTNLYYKYEFGGTYQPKKTVNLQNQHNKSIKKLNCNWKLNLSSVTDLVHITSLYDNHCHEDIQYLIVNDTYDLSTIRSLLSAKYPDQPFFTRNLANIVAQLQREYCVEENDASLLLTKLYKYKEIEEATGILPRVLITDENLSIKHIASYNLLNTKHLFCLYHLSQNILKNLKSKLGEQYSNFIKDFYITCNSLSEDNCEHLLIFKIFTEGMQLTQKVKGLNRHIKTAINSPSTLLLVMEINYNNHIALQYVFPQIVKQINKYLTPNLAAKQQKQIIESTIYRAQALLFNNTNLNKQISNTLLELFLSTDANILLNSQEFVYDNNFIKNTYNILQSYLLALITKVEYLSVQEIWKFQVHIEKKLQFVKTISLAKQAITLQDNDKNNCKLEDFLRNYIKKKNLNKCQNSDVLSIVIQINNEKLVFIKNVADSVYHVDKEAPCKKHIKDKQENY
ncbi:3053_t:CDS:2 [Cetraspora pellucida]|uniref:3053_t:CDS:1 n=1 Tax=Cetraspora pellucida TaxID=1433469 RepID=A0A9N9G713_9GLOM|nr:3053_t:CDS:2 [Cetraspora pellucida]